MLATHKGEIPFFILIIPLLLGLGLGWQFSSGNLIPYLIIIFSALAVLFITLNLLYKRLQLYKWQWLGGLLLHLTLFSFGWLCICNYNELNAADHFSKKPAAYLLIKINNEPVLSGALLRFTASVESVVKDGKTAKASGSLLVTVKDSGAKSLYYGDELLIPANYQPVEPTYVPAAFNYKQYLANQNIHYQSFLAKHQYAVVGQNTGNPVIAYSLRLRQRLVEKLKANMHAPAAIAVASTLILGYKADLSNDVLQAYSKTGTIHVLSVSGAHVAIIYVLLNLALGFLDRFPRGKLIKAFITIGLIWYYSLLSGFSPAVCRAAVMISMVIIGKTYNRHINTLNILAFSAFALLIYDPYFIADVGFQLSYLAVFGLIVFQPVLYQLFEFKHKWADGLWALLSVSIAAQVITFPLSAFYFHQFPVYFLLSNLFIIIPSAVIMYSGIALLVLPQIPYLSKFLAMVLEQSILTMNQVLSLIEQAPFSGISKIWITNAEYLLLYVIIISFFYFLYNGKKALLKLSMAALLVFCVSISYKKIRMQQSSTIAFLNLRRHTAIVMRSGSQAAVLTDLADTDKTYRYSVQPYLDSCKIVFIRKLGLRQDGADIYFHKKANFVEFINKRLLIFDQQTPTSVLSQKLKINYLFVTGNPYAELDKINQIYNYQYLIVDANNGNALINRLNERAGAQKIKAIILKRNKSLILVSN